MSGEARALLLAVFAAVTLSMAACEAPTDEQARQGGDEPAQRGSEPAPPGAAQVAYSTTAEARSARFSMLSVTTGLPEGQGMPDRFTTTAGGLTEFQSGETRMVMRMTMLGQVEMRITDGMAYMKFPEQSLAQIAPGKSWVVMDREQMMREQYGSDLSGMQGVQQDPTQQLEYLRGVSDSVERVGTQEVRGVPTTHYRAIVDLDEAAPADPEARQAYERLRQQIGQSRIPTEVWLDDEGRVRRHKMTMAVSPAAIQPESAGEAKTTVTVEYYDFGVPVRVTPPPAEETVPMEKLTQQPPA